jgi:hypothetical protein
VNVGKCKSCGKKILWAKTIHDKPVPLDPEPIEGGNVDLGANGIAYVVPVEPPPARKYVSHFATCEFAASHRKARTS